MRLSEARERASGLSEVVTKPLLCSVGAWLPFSNESTASHSLASPVGARAGISIVCFDLSLRETINPNRPSAKTINTLVPENTDARNPSSPPWTLMLDGGA